MRCWKMQECVKRKLSLDSKIKEDLCSMKKSRIRISTLNVIRRTGRIPGWMIKNGRISLLRALKTILLIKKYSKLPLKKAPRWSLQKSYSQALSLRFKIWIRKTLPYQESLRRFSVSKRTCRALLLKDTKNLKVFIIKQVMLWHP